MAKPIRRRRGAFNTVAAKVFYGAGKAIKTIIKKKVAGKQKAKAKNGSKTMLTKKKKAASTTMSVHNDLSVRNLGTVKVGKQGYYRSLGTYSYRNTNQWLMTATQGLSCIDYPEIIGTRDHFVGNVSNVRNARGLVPDDLFALNPYVKMPTTSPIFPLATPTIPDTDKLWLKSAKTKMSLLSMTTVAQIVQVYWCTPVTDTNANPIDCYYAAVADEASGQNAQVKANDLGDTTAGEGWEEPDHWGAKLFSKKAILKTWRCLKTKTVILQPGDQMHLALNIQFNTMLERSSMLSMRSNSFLKGITVFPVLITSAGMVAVTADGVAPEVAYAGPKVGVIHDYTYTFAAVPVNQRSVSRAYNGTIVGTTQTLELINDEDEIVMKQDIQ